MKMQSTFVSIGTNLLLNLSFDIQHLFKTSFKALFSSLINPGIVVIFLFPVVCVCEWETEAETHTQR